MQALKFDLSGKTAFFKKPDVNSYVYFTYGHIHKISLLGMLGSIVGLDGYSLQGEKTYPEFYEQLRDVKISIVPNNKEGYITKKIQTFNNSVGYASQEQGGNLIVKEQWLEHPNWTIYLLLNNKDKTKNLEERLIESRYVYIPYLGKNDHFANIKNVEKVDLNPIENVEFINSMFIDKYFSVIDDEEVKDIFAEDLIVESKWKYRENLPTYLEEITNKYEYENFSLTNMKVSQKQDYIIYSNGYENLFFF